MFCTKCGKKLEDDSKFCTYCGSPVTGSTASNIEDVIKKASDTAMNAAKSAGNVVRESVEKIDGEAVKDTIKKATDTAVNLAQSAKNAANEVANGQTEKYAERAKEAAQGFAGDIKNKHKNTKILVGVIIVFLVLVTLLSGGNGTKSARKSAEKFIAVRAEHQHSFSKVKKAKGKFVESGTVNDKHFELYIVRIKTKSGNASYLVDMIEYEPKTYSAHYALGPKEYDYKYSQSDIEQVKHYRTMAVD